MARICKKCGGEVPRYFWVDGKKRNCQNRKYCLSCSPFGEHNTRQIEKIPQGRKPKRQEPGYFAHYFKEKQKGKIEKVQEIVGNKCWLCGYDKTWKNLCFHHVDPSLKLFGLSTREFVGYAWNRVLLEMKKCILVCQNCHGEIHDGLIDESEIKQLYGDKWKFPERKE